MHGNQHAKKWHYEVGKANQQYVEAKEPALDYDKAGLYVYVSGKTTGAATYSWVPVVNAATFFYRPLGLQGGKSPYRLYRLGHWHGPAAPDGRPNINVLFSAPKVKKIV